MRFRNYSIRLLCVLFLLLLLFPGCWGDDSDDPALVLSGTLTMPDAVKQSDAPVMVAVLRSMDADALASQTADAVIDYVTADKAAGTFRIDLTDAPVSPGDEVYLIAFADNNYSGDVPFPDEGDYIGIYFNEERLSPACTIKAGTNTGIHIDINREVFDYQAAITGDILGDDTGPVTLLAYAGEVSSSDFSALDMNKVIGFARVDKPAGPCSYRMDILPYGEDVPIDNVQVFAVLDLNRSGTVDAGDRIGFHSQCDEFSTPFTVVPGTVGAIDVEFKMQVPEPSGYSMSLTGTAPGTFPREAPFYISIFDAGSPGDILQNPYEGLKYFQKVPSEVVNYQINLSGTDLYPGDKVVIAALQDNDFDGGFPGISGGDKTGLVQAPQQWKLTTELACGVNVIPPPHYEFALNKDVYEFNASIEHLIDLSSAGPVYSDTLIMVLAVHVDGVGLKLSASGEMQVEIDINYLLGMDVLPVSECSGRNPEDSEFDVGGPWQMPVMPALYERVLVYEDSVPPEPLIRGHAHGTAAERTSYLFAVLDKNGNLEVDGADEVGYYSRQAYEIIDGEIAQGLLGVFADVLLLSEDFSGDFHLPAPMPRITRGVNRETRMDGSKGPYRISHFFLP
ncbi:MAG: hypothetical protein R6X08_02350 [Desulfosalsimonadaceae bacterium]